MVCGQIVDNYRAFVKDILQHFGVRRHAEVICEAIEDGEVDAFKVFCLMTDSECSIDPPASLAQE